jgi:hypothetical protein
MPAKVLICHPADDVNLERGPSTSSASAAKDSPGIDDFSRGIFPLSGESEGERVAKSVRVQRTNLEEGQKRPGLPA